MELLAAEGIALPASAIQRTGRLTPRRCGREAAELPSATAVIALHIKPIYRAEVVSEPTVRANGRIQEGEVGREYDF